MVCDTEGRLFTGVEIGAEIVAGDAGAKLGRDHKPRRQQPPRFQQLVDVGGGAADEAGKFGLATSSSDGALKSRKCRIVLCR